MKKESIQKRKQDTRTKIQMGGLVKKAGLQYLYDKNPAILLGLFIELKQKIDSGKLDIEYLKQFGLKEMTKP